MARGRPKKDKFADLSDEFKDAIAQSSEVEIKDRIVTITQREVENAQNRAEDLHLAECIAAKKDAEEQYTDAATSLALQKGFCLRVLKDRKEA